MLEITKEPKRVMWYSGLSGHLAPFCGKWPEAYKSREPAGYTNRIEFSDAEPVEAEVRARCPMCAAEVVFGGVIGDYPLRTFHAASVPRALATALKKQQVTCACGAHLRLDIPYFEPADTEGSVSAIVTRGRGKDD